MSAAVIVPAYEAQGTIVEVVTGLRREVGPEVPIWVVDDGSRDATAELARAAGARVLVHERNRGKGAGLRTGLRAAADAGCEVAVTVDADGQHPPEEAKRLLDAPFDAATLVLGVREFARSGAPRANVVGNRASNFFVSLFARRRLRDTQCGLRRYPVTRTLALRSRDQRFGFEAEIILVAARAGLAIVQVPVRVVYPKGERRTTHYRSVGDTVHIVARITATVLYPVRWLLALLALACGCLLSHRLIVWSTRMLPPEVSVATCASSAEPGHPDVVRIERDYARHRGKIWEVALSGSPEEIGAHHALLLRSEMLANEAALWSKLEQLVPSAWARLVVFDIARLRFRNIDLLMSDAHRREIAATADAMQPDPWSSRIPSYQRMVYLHSLYDVSLSFEHSPLIGCTSFALNGARTNGGHTLLARNFDFEAGDIFDEHKAVFVVHEVGRLGYASVAWPGLIGVVTGVNEAGVALVVHGARAKKSEASGEPLVHTMRDVLGLAHSTEEAIAILRARGAMVSHMVMVADASGDAAVVERAPGVAPWVRRGTDQLAVTNHFEGPLASDPQNRWVERETSTLARRARLDELLGAMVPRADVADAIALLRDQRAPGGAELPRGDRRAIDAQIATHAVVIDATERIMWVSEGPHLAGRFVRFDVGRLLRNAAPLDDGEPAFLP